MLYSSEVLALLGCTEQEMAARLRAASTACEAARKAAHAAYEAANPPPVPPAGDYGAPELAARAAASWAAHIAAKGRDPAATATALADQEAWSTHRYAARERYALARARWHRAGCLAEPAGCDRHTQEALWEAEWGLRKGGVGGEQLLEIAALLEKVGAL